MKLDRTITTEESESTVRDRVITYLKRADYKQVGLQPVLVYERGSLLGSLTSFYPKHWQVKATVRITPNPDQTTSVVVSFNINTTGQWVIKRERDFWNSEIDDLETAVHSGDVNVATIANEMPQTKLTREEGEAPPQSIGRWAKALVTLWGTVMFLPALPLVPGFCCVVAEAASYDDPGTRAFGLGVATLMAVGLACGGTMLFQGSSALSMRPSKRLRLPPLWGMVGGFVLALVTGLGLWQMRGLATLLGPWFIIAAAALPPLAALVWAVNERPGWLTWRRAGVAFSAGATVSVILAIVLEILAPLSILWLLLDLGDPVLDALEGLVNLLAGGGAARALTSSGFLLTLFELAVVAPLVEEFAKSLVVLPLLRGTKSRRDVFLLGAAAGAGFAAVENVLYALFGGRYWGGILLVRALGAAVHPLGTGLMALAWSDSLGFKNPKGLPRGLLAALAVGQHALWNGGLVLWMALSGAAFFGPEPWEADVMGVSIAVGMLALVALEGVALWVGMRALSRRLEPPEAVATLAREELPTERAIALWAVVCLLALLPVGMAVLRGLWFR